MQDEHMQLSATQPADVVVARRELRAHLQQWRCGQIDDGVLVCSELATNAVRHAGGATRIDVVHGDRELRFEVHDRSHAVPTVRTDGDARGGFGLRIVSQIALRWGWEQTAEGKRVWCVVPCCPDD